MARKDREFWESATRNNAVFNRNYNRLTELAISMFEWKNVPDSIDTRFLELILFANGMAVFFKDENLGYLALKVAVDGQLNVYRIPTRRRAYADNGFNLHLDEKNSVIIWNNYLHTNSMADIMQYAIDLSDLERSISINAKAQKTPVLIACDEDERLSMKNLYMQYDGNQPFIFGTKSLSNPNSPLKVLNTGAPYVADKLYTLKTQIWNEALTYLGVPNVNITKKERLVTDEVDRLQGGTIASRQSRLQMRKIACDEINKMFGLNISVDYRDVDEYAEDSESEVKEDE